MMIIPKTIAIIQAHCLVLPRFVNSFSVLSSPVVLCSVLSSPVRYFQVCEVLSRPQLSPVQSCRVLSSPVKSCHVLSSHLLLSLDKSCQSKLDKKISLFAK
jgi:hypothetical protein